jgi:SWIM zinc finger
VPTLTRWHAVVAVEVSERSIRMLADGRSFERGQAYAAAGRVRRVEVSGTTVTSTVHGTSVYRVRLEVAGSGLRGRCSCPYGSEGVFCKHCVATALVWLADGAELGESRRQPPAERQLRAFLLGQDSAWLVDELLSAARDDPLLLARLEVAAGADPAAVYDDAELRQRLVRAIEIGDYVDYHGAYSYFGQVEEALDGVAELTDAGFAGTAMTLAEFALDLLEGAADRVDDSDGGLHVAIARAEEIHLAACTAAAPDPVALAELLVSRALASEYEVFFGLVRDYEQVLGPTGMARCRDLVEQARKALPPSKAGDYSTRRFIVNHLLEELAETSGGTDALIAVLAANLTSGYDVLRIAERLCADGRDDEALGWLDRGMSEFEPDPRLRTLAAECHARAGRLERSGELLWTNFAERPDLGGYRALREGTGNGFPEWRERALALLRSQPPERNPWQPGRSVLVEILLWDGDIDVAWHTAMESECSEQLWLRLARARATSHPADAIPVLLRAANRAIEERNRASYRTAADLLTDARSLSARCGTDEAFLGHLVALRSTHRAKRALREELDRVGLD